MKRKLSAALVLIVLGVAAFGGKVLATPGNSGFKGTTLAHATFGELKLHAHGTPTNAWQELLMTQGDSDLYVQSNVWQPGGSTGWHTHPGPSLIILTKGVLTQYDSDDPTCQGHAYLAGSSFVDLGGRDVHMLRNDGDIPAETIAVQLIPAGATRRIDAPAPLTCSP